MKKMKLIIPFVPVYLLLIVVFMVIAFFLNDAVTVISENQAISNRNTIIIDAGHGGVDGGATSCTGVLESQINLEIAKRLNDLMNLMGIRTVMIRTTDESIYTKGESIAEKKISDLKERVRIVNGTNNSILISIHQNHFSDNRYNGAQVFYAKTALSQEFAKEMQSNFVETLNPGSKRMCKSADGIYLMKHVQCPAVLIECGFLSNPHEEANLRNEKYQKNISCVIASVTSRYVAQLDSTA